MHIDQEGRMKLFLSADDTIVYVQNPKGSTERKKKRKISKLLEEVSSAQ